MGDLIHMDEARAQRDMTAKAAKKVDEIAWDSRVAMFASVFVAGGLIGLSRSLGFQFASMRATQSAILNNQELILQGLEHVSGQLVEAATNNFTVREVLKLAAKQ